LNRWKAKPFVVIAVIPRKTFQIDRCGTHIGSCMACGEIPAAGQATEGNEQQTRWIKNEE
jgi:hypothetical protein